MRTYQHLEKSVHVLISGSSRNLMSVTYIIVENIEKWVSTPIVLNIETYVHIILEIMLKGTFVQNHAKLF